jgi:hypothetical protein
LCRSASGAALLVRSLPRLRRLAYQNMRRVVALLLQPGGQAEKGKAGQYGQAGRHGEAGQYDGEAGQYDEAGQYGKVGQNGEAGQYGKAGQNGEAGQYGKAGQNGEAGQYKVFEYGLDFLDSMEHTGEYDLEVEDGSYWASGRGLPPSLSLHWVWNLT